MRFHALLVLRDEADIIRHTLAHLLSWCDSLHVLDTGSTDGTWDIVQDAARADRRLVPVASRAMVFDCNLRGELFNHARAQYSQGDWVARVDADEIYHSPPPLWIKEHTRRWETRIFAQMYEFLITRGELAAWRDTSESPELARRRYIIEPVIELRFFRYRRAMHWNFRRAQPHNVGFTALERIPIRHYRWRSPAQMQARCRLRAAQARLSPHGCHWSRDNWLEWVADDHDPRLRTWNPGEGLPPVHMRNHLAPPLLHLAQAAVHRTGLVHVLDRLRSLQSPVRARRRTQITRSGTISSPA